VAENRGSRKRRRARGAAAQRRSRPAQPDASPVAASPPDASHDAPSPPDASHDAPSPPDASHDAPDSPEPASSSLQRGYSRSRAKDEAARAALVPLEPGERPLAVTVGAIAAALLSVSNLIALAFGYNTDEPRLTTGTILAAAVLALVAWGMWRARYWAVLGMQTLLAITIVFAGLALMTAYSWWAAVLMVIIIALAGTLFWFLVKAMARIQMPERPSASR
jgi:cation transport ATPase